MERIALTNGSGKWFNREGATVYDEGHRWNGQNHISLVTGSQWEHQELLYTAGKGAWILHSWSQWQGSTPTYEDIAAAEAAAWFATNQLEPPDELSDAVAALEV